MMKTTVADTQCSSQTTSNNVDRLVPLDEYNNKQRVIDPKIEWSVKESSIHSMVNGVGDNFVTGDISLL